MIFFFFSTLNSNIIPYELINVCFQGQSDLILICVLCETQHFEAILLNLPFSFMEMLPIFLLNEQPGDVDLPQTQKLMGYNVTACLADLWYVNTFYKSQ